MEYIDYVLELPWGDNAENDGWKLANDWKSWWVTPFKETVKLDCDIIFTRDVSHWWDLMCEKDIFISSTIYDFKGEKSDVRAYRKIIDDNSLLDAYNGFTYFRYSKTSADFFMYVKHIFKNWHVFRDHVLFNCRQEKPTTDEVYAIAALLLGEDQCYIPNTHIGFTHMKPAVNHMGKAEKCFDQLVSQLDQPRISIGLYDQHYPVHYQDKDIGKQWAKEYE